MEKGLPGNFKAGLHFREHRHVHAALIQCAGLFNAVGSRYDMEFGAKAVCLPDDGLRCGD